jgi:hypothetical protein
MLSAISRTPNSVWAWPESMDALIAAPEHHTLRMENENMRVVQTRIRPGQTVPVHTHGFGGVLFIQSGTDLIRRDQHGNVLLDTRRSPDKPMLSTPLWQEPLPPHRVENVGGAEFTGVQVEIKDAL